jgi:hypothetical protein
MPIWDLGLVPFVGERIKGSIKEKKRKKESLKGYYFCRLIKAHP